MGKCYACGEQAELRPYGPRGEMICFPCAMKPERKKATEQQFLSQLNAAGPVALVGQEFGPIPYKKDTRHD